MKAIVGIILFSIVFPINEKDNISFQYGMLGRLESKNNQIPRVVQKWMEGDITLETLVILDSLTGFVKKEGKNIAETIIWPDISRKIRKYSPFVRVDKKKYSNILKKTFTKSQ